MKVYSYSRHVLVIHNGFKILALVVQILLLPVTIFLGWGLILEGGTILFALAITLIFALLMWGSINSAVHYILEIGVDDQAIYIKHYWRWFRIPWEDVIELKPEWFTKIFRPKDPNFVLLARRLPPIYWLYGLVYVFHPRPGFMISNAIEDRQPLITKINQKINQNQKRLKYNKIPINH